MIKHVKIISRNVFHGFNALKIIITQIGFTDNNVVS